MESERTPPHFRLTKTHSLPEEIIEEILSWLPVKSLLKFRCVSKSWRSLIGTKRFIKTHLGNSRKNENLTHHRIILNSYPSSKNRRSISHCSLLSLLNEPVTHSIAFDHLIYYTPADLIRVVGCCDGLICLLIGGKKFIVWNPSTRLSRKLPDFDDQINFGSVTKYGFGFDELSGDYKIFGVLVVFLATGTYQAIGKIYSFKSDSWKLVKDRDVNPFDDKGKLVNGKLHWARKFGLDSGWDIRSFDLKREVYGIVEQPNYPQGGFHPSLGVLKDRLCVLCDYRRIRYDVWVLKQYGVRESWEKIVTVPYDCDPWKGSFSTPLCIGPNGEILIMYGSAFSVYYPKYGRFCYPKIFDLDAFRDADLYIESLVSVQ